MAWPFLSTTAYLLLLITDQCNFLVLFVRVVLFHTIMQVLVRASLLVVCITMLLLTVLAPFQVQRFSSLW